MSVEIVATIICDLCGSMIVGPVQTTTSQGCDTYYYAKREMQRQRWIHKTRYGKAQHICGLCADGTPPQNPVISIAPEKLA